MSGRYWGILRQILSWANVAEPVLYPLLTENPGSLWLQKLSMHPLLQVVIQ